MMKKPISSLMQGVESGKLRVSLIFRIIVSDTVSKFSYNSLEIAGLPSDELMRSVFFFFLCVKFQNKRGKRNDKEIKVRSHGAIDLIL